MREKTTRRLLHLAEFSPLVTGALLAVVLFTLPVGTTTSFLAQGLTPPPGYDAKVRAEIVAAGYEAPDLLAADLDGLQLAIDSSWPLTALRQDEFFSATKRVTLPFSADATPFAPLEKWERAQHAHVWAWVALPPARPAVVASATGDPATLHAAEMNAMQPPTDGFITSDEASIGALVNAAENPSGLPSTTVPAVNPGDIGPGGGGDGGDDYMLVSFMVSSAGQLWRYHLVGPGTANGTEPDIRLPVALQTADPAAPGFQGLVTRTATETRYSIIVLGPYHYDTLALRAPAGTSAETAAALGKLVWPSWMATLSNWGADQIRDLDPQPASLAGGHRAALLTSNATASAYGKGLQPQTVLYLAVWDQPPGGTPSAMQSLWRTWQLTLARDFPWFAVGTLLLFALSLGAAPVAFVFERRREARARLADALEQIRLDAHDKVFNRLSALSKRVALAGDEVRATPSPQLKEVAEDIRGTVAALQEILGSELSHVESTLTSVPLAEQLASVTSAQAARFGFSATFAAHGEIPEVAPRTGWDLQCVAEEALTNAARHGHAANARVELGGGEHLLTLTISDDGRGEPSGISIDDLPDTSTGLRGMRARVGRLGGTLAIDSTPQGTTVSVRLPL